MPLPLLATLAALAALLLAPPSFAQTLRTAAQDSPPKFILSADGTLSGISIDVMRAIQKLEPSISFMFEDRFMPLRRIERQLEQGEIDVFFGFIKNKDRLDRFVFIEPPLYKSTHVLVARRGDPINIKRLEEIKALGDKGVVMISAGNAQIDQLRSLGILVDDRGTSLDQNLQKLLRGRGRFIFHSEIGISEMSETHPPELTEAIRVLPTRFNEQGRYIAFSRTVPEATVKKVKVALDQLSASGELRRIVKKYND